MISQPERVAFLDRPAGYVIPPRDEAAAVNPLVWGLPDRPLELFARNVSTRYLAVFIDGSLGLAMLPFNMSHLGPSAYGLWALTTSVTCLFGMLDLGYGGALVKFIARYRAWRDRAASNEMLSTVGLVFVALARRRSGNGRARLRTSIAVQHRARADAHRTMRADDRRHLPQRQVSVIIYGAVVYGFQRYYRNNAVSIGISLAVAAVNVAVFGAGHGLVGLVAATTAIRLVPLGLYRAERVAGLPGSADPTLLVSPRRLREVTGFSLYMSSSIGPRRSTIRRITGDRRDARHDRGRRVDRRPAARPGCATADAPAERRVVSERWSIAMRGSVTIGADDLDSGDQAVDGLAAPLCLGLIVLAEPLIPSWVGPQFAASVGLRRFCWP